MFSSLTISVAPGATALTVIPRAPSSFASTRVNCSTAALLEFVELFKGDVDRWFHQKCSGAVD